MLNSLVNIETNEHYSKVLVSPDMILRKAISPDVTIETLALLRKLVPDEFVMFLIAYLNAGLERFGHDWVYADIVTVLIAAAQLCKPTRYLEIGVRRGRSLAGVVTQSPDVDVYAFDQWTHNYAGMPNPGPEFVIQEMEHLGYKKKIHFINGNSHLTLPKFFIENPNIEFDLITVDGDHNENGALQDLRDVLPHLAIGGIIVFDDVSHPYLLHLQSVWHRAITEDGGIKATEFTELGYGVAIGVRHYERKPRIQPGIRLKSRMKKFISQF